MSAQEKVSVPTSAGTKEYAVASREEWLAARLMLLAKEKEFTRLRDDLSRQRRALPWVKVDRQYVFESPAGSETLADLFGKRSQLIVYHFMFAPDSEQGCKHCSFWADHFDAVGLHLHRRDVSFTAISRAPLPKIDAFKKRMGWKFKWVSSAGTDFNYDYQASFTPADIASGSVFYNFQHSKMPMSDREGISVFYKNDRGNVFHTYSCYARGIDMVNATYQFLDLVPKGRDEEGLKSSQAWVRYHDQPAD